MTIQFSGMDQTLRNSIEASVRTYLLYHSGALAEFGLGQDNVDRLADIASARLQQEERLDATTVLHRARSMNSLRTQIEENILGNDSGFGHDVITLDCELIDLAYHVPAHAPEEMDESEDLRFTNNNFNISYTNWAQFVGRYRMLANYLTYNYEATMETFKNIQNPFIFYAYETYRTRYQTNPLTFNGPEYRVTGITNSRDRTIRSCLESTELSLLVRVRGQITNMSASRASYYSVAWRCRCGFINNTRQNDYDDQLIKPGICNGDECELTEQQARFQMLDAPYSKSRTIKRALLQEEMVSSSDTPVVLIEFHDSACKQVDTGEVVTLIGYIRSRASDSKSRNDRNREVYMVVTGIERNEQSSDLRVSDEREAEIRTWADGLDFDGKMEILTRSFASEIHGRDKVKRGLLLQQAGGSQNAHGLRYDVHLVMFGDPGTGKSVLAEYVRGMHPGTKKLTGERASRAGLIASISSTSEMFSGGDKRVIEPGSLALVPPGGVCIIDEAQNLNASELAEMNTALEAQEVEISMSLKGTVSTRTPVVLIANPLKSDNAKFDPFDPHRSIIQQAGFKESTMTRMDLAYFLFDEKNSAEEERRRSRSIFAKMGGVAPQNSNNEGGEILPPEFMRDFLILARTHSHLEFTQEAIDVLVEDQVSKRTAANEDDVVSQRRSASLARLAAAAAKLDFSDTINIPHAEFALRAMSEAEQDRNPSVMRGAKIAEVRDLREHVLVAFYNQWDRDPDATKTRYQVLDIEAGLDTYWESEWGVKPNLTQLKKTLESLAKDSATQKGKRIMKVARDTFTFE